MSYTEGWEKSWILAWDKAFQNGFEKGEKIGYDKGYIKGMKDEEDLNKGFDSYEAGYRTGNEEGWDKGYDTGYNEGYNDAYEDMTIETNTKSGKKCIHHTIPKLNENLLDSKIVNNNNQNDDDSTILSSETYSSTYSDKYENKEFEQDMWDCAKTFKNVCFLGSLWCQNLIKVQPGCGITECDNLYELNNLDNVRNIIIEYNKLGFFTTMSQPGKIDIDTNISTDTKNVQYRQRASISGYVKLSTWLKLAKRIENDEYIFAEMNRCGKSYVLEHYELNAIKKTQNFKSQQLSNRLMTATFINNEFPIDIYNKKINDKTIHIITLEDEGISYFWTNACCETQSINDYIGHEIIDDDEIIPIHIFDKEWGNNDRLWNLILQVLQSE